MKNTNKIEIPSYEDIVAKAMRGKTAVQHLQEGYRHTDSFVQAWGTGYRTTVRRLESLCRAGVAKKVFSVSGARRCCLYKLL